MLAIRMQRVGRKGHAQYRVVVQDRRFSPKSGRVVAYVGSYNPHAKTAIIDSDKISSYLKNGAQPSDRVAQILKKEGVKLPGWVSKPTKKQRSVRNPEKRAKKPAEVTPAAEPPASEETKAEQPAESEAPAEEASEPTQAADEAPAEESPSKNA